jgi:PKHD-type hydroxylase
MLITIANLLSPEELSWLRQTLANAPFVDGKLSAGAAARRVKQNQELDPSTSALEPIYRLFMTSLGKNAEFRSAALPLRVSDPVFARYGAGMAYGEHIDDPVMGGMGGPRFRCDVALTLFLNDPEDYKGGALVVRTAFGTQRVKLPAGHGVVYPASSVHQVEPVTAGQRLVAVAWVQSMVRGAERRELLHELHHAREELLRTMPEEEQTKRVDWAYTNLVRMWAEV